MLIEPATTGYWGYWVYVAFLVQHILLDPVFSFLISFFFTLDSCEEKMTNPPTEEKKGKESEIYECAYYLTDSNHYNNYNYFTWEMNYFITPLYNIVLHTRCSSDANWFTIWKLLCLPFPSVFSLSESEQREQRQPVAWSYRQESGDWRQSGGKWGRHPVKASGQEAAGRSLRKNSYSASTDSYYHTVKRLFDILMTLQYFSCILTSTVNPPPNTPVSFSYLSLDLRSPLWAQATCEPIFRDSWPYWALLCPERGSDGARWPGRRGVEVLRGPTAGTWAVRLLSAGPFCELHPRQ